MQIHKPIFVIGHARTGSTLLQKLLALHPDLGWFSGWTNRYPQRPQLALISRMMNWHWFERISRNWRYVPRPAEAYYIWAACFYEFKDAEHDWDASYVTKEGAERLRWLIKTHLQWQGKKRFLTKYTSWPRIDFIRAIFPDAQFLYIERDPRAVVYSFMQRKYWFQHDPAALERLPMKERLSFYSQKYLEHYHAKRYFIEGEDYQQIYYENLIAKPVEVLKTVCAMLELRPDEHFIQRASSWSFNLCTNTKWQDALDTSERELLGCLLQQPLAEMGYLLPQVQTTTLKQQPTASRETYQMQTQPR